MVYWVFVWFCVDDGRCFLGYGFFWLVWLFFLKVRKKIVKIMCLNILLMFSVIVGIDENVIIEVLVGYINYEW